MVAVVLLFAAASLPLALGMVGQRVVIIVIGAVLFWRSSRAPAEAGTFR